MTAEELASSSHPGRRLVAPRRLAFIDAVPKTSVGKFDKKVLRKELEEGRLTLGEPAHARASSLSGAPG